MEEIDIKELFKYFLSKLLLIFIVVSLVFMMGWVYELVIKVPSYKSNTTLVLTMINESSIEDDSGITTNDITLNQKLVPTYREIIKSRKILKQVIDELNLDYTLNELADKITVTSVEETEIIKITVVSEDSEEAKNIVNKTARIFSNEIKEIYNIKNVTVIDEGEVAQNPYNVNLVKSIIIYVLLGFVLSLIIVFGLYYFDTTIKTVEQVENKLKLPILGTINLYDASKRRRKNE